MVDGGDRACAMEVSSHALSLNRVDGIRFAVGGVHQPHPGPPRLPLTTWRTTSSPSAGCSPAAGAERAVINVDDPYGDRLAAEFEAITFSATGDARADLRARRPPLRRRRVALSLRRPRRRGSTSSLPLPGRFNVENALCAIGCAVALGIELADAVAALADAERVPGRFEPVDEGQPFAVLVDYAHTPDSLENVLASARQITRPTAG